MYANQYGMKMIINEENEIIVGDRDCHDISSDTLRKIAELVNADIDSKSQESSS